MNLLESIGLTDRRSGTSARNAQSYMLKLLEAVAILSDVNNKNKSTAEPIQLSSTDTVIISTPVSIDGQMKRFKMAFSHADLDPYAVEIIEAHDYDK